MQNWVWALCKRRAGRIAEEDHVAKALNDGELKVESDVQGVMS